MKIRVNGQDFVGYESASASRHFLDLCGTFSFSAAPLSIDNQNYPIRVGDQCQIIVENTPFVTGFVESIDVKSRAQNVVIDIQGRDKTCDFVDSSIDNNFIPQFDGSKQLTDICTKALNVLGITGIDVINTVSNLPDRDWETKSQVLSRP